MTNKDKLFEEAKLKLQYLKDVIEQKIIPERPKTLEAKELKSLINRLAAK